MAADQLAKLQGALAALLMEVDSLAAFQADPQAYAEEHGLLGKNADLLARLPYKGAAYFASRRRIDRHGYLRSDLPKSVHVLMDHDVGTDAYFDDCPYAFEDPRKELQQFLKWTQTGAKTGRCSQLLADVALLETTARTLIDKPHRAAKPGQQAKRAPGVKVIELQHDLWDQIEDEEIHEAPAGKIWVALQRTKDDVEPHRLTAAEAGMLAAKGKPQGSPGAEKRLRRLGLLG